MHPIRAFRMIRHSNPLYTDRHNGAYRNSFFFARVPGYSDPQFTRGIQMTTHEPTREIKTRQPRGPKTVKGPAREILVRSLALVADTDDGAGIWRGVQGTLRALGYSQDEIAALGDDAENYSSDTSSVF